MKHRRRTTLRISTAAIAICLLSLIVSGQVAYLYDTASFVSVPTREGSLRRWGYHAGLDLTQRIWKSVGVGVIARYSRATFKFPIVENQEAAIDAGGLHVGGGVRLQF